MFERINPPTAWEKADLERIADVLDSLELPFGWSLRAAYDGGTLFVQVRATEEVAIDNVTGEPIEWRGRKWLLSRHMTKGEIAQTVLKAVLTAAEHEIRETLLYGQAAVFDPHYDIAKLAELRRRPDALKERG